jgi:hypothetical protein
MHDGFVTKNPIDAKLIERQVLASTGYRLELSGGAIVPSPDLGFPKREHHTSH